MLPHMLGKVGKSQDSEDEQASPPIDQVQDSRDGTFRLPMLSAEFYDGSRDLYRALNPQGVDVEFETWIHEPPVQLAAGFLLARAMSYANANFRAQASRLRDEPSTNDRASLISFMTVYGNTPSIAEVEPLAPSYHGRVTSPPQSCSGRSSAHTNGRSEDSEISSRM